MKWVKSVRRTMRIIYPSRGRLLLIVKNDFKKTKDFLNFRFVWNPCYGLCCNIPFHYLQWTFQQYIYCCWIICFKLRFIFNQMRQLQRYCLISTAEFINYYAVNFHYLFVHNDLHNLRGQPPMKKPARLIPRQVDAVVRTFFSLPL
jgi:hypothetical protein